MHDIGDIVLCGTSTGVIVQTDPVLVALCTGEVVEPNNEIVPILGYKDVLEQFQMGVLQCQL